MKILKNKKTLKKSKKYRRKQGGTRSFNTKTTISPRKKMTTSPAKKKSARKTTLSMGKIKSNNNKFIILKTPWRVNDCVAPLAMLNTNRWYKIVSDNGFTWYAIQMGGGGGADELPKSLEQSDQWVKIKC